MPPLNAQDIINYKTNLLRIEVQEIRTFMLGSLLFFSGFLYAEQKPVAKRTSFDIPLIKISVLLENDSSEFRDVKIPLDGKKEYVIISEQSDTHIKITRKGEQKTIYAEAPGSRLAFTSFEAQHFISVVSSLLQTLELFEMDLEKQRWDRCLYLDSFFPKFLKAFYYLNSTALSSHNVLPPQANIADSLFDISLASEKTDQRIQRWIKNKESVIKLRISTRELIFHLRDWIQQELSNPELYSRVEYTNNLEEAYLLFIRLYFNQEKAE